MVINWKAEMIRRGFRKVLCWDIEARHHKPDEMGWPEYKQVCGISIAGVYDIMEPLFGWTFYSDADATPYSASSLSQALMAADLSVGYNTMSYDHTVVRGLVDGHNPDKELDLYSQVIKRSYVEAFGHYPRGKGLWKLDAFCKRTIGHGKTLTQGAMAPALCKTGRWGELVTYNLHDVALVAGLFMWMLVHRTVVLPDGDLLEIGDALDHGLERVTGLRQAAIAS